MGLEDFYHKVFRLTPIPTILIKPEESNFIVFDVNTAFLGLLNISVNEVIGKNPEEVYSKFPGIKPTEFTENMMEGLQTLSNSTKNGYQ